MLFRCVSFLYTHINFIFFERKETLSPLSKFLNIPPMLQNENGGRAFFFAPLKEKMKDKHRGFGLRAGLTVEASVALPVFVILMMAVLHFGNVMNGAARYGSALCETGEKMAVAAYASEYGEKHKVLAVGLSAAYARSSVLEKAGSNSAVKNTNFLLSSFLEDNDMIHLVMTYQVKAPVGGITLPGIFFLQRASVRGWTGRKGSGGASEENGEGETKGQTVYVTEHGTVYHTDPHCTHIKLSIQLVDRDSLGARRNNGGEIYHSCEKCGKYAGNQVYITAEGNRYHSSLECSGLKRTVQQVSLEEAEHLRPCSKCGGGSAG